MALSQTLESYLVDHQVAFELEHHEFSLSSLCAARAAHVDERFLAKSVLLEDENGPLLAVLPAARRLELARVREQFGRRLRFTPEEETEQFFPDCALGAMPPLGVAFGLPAVVDRSLESAAEIFFEAGDHETLVRMQGAVFFDLMRSAARGVIASESPAWIAARNARERLYDSILRVSDAITAPTASGERWHRRLRHEVEALQRALTEHVLESESPDGLLRQIEGQAPHLAREVDELRVEHVELEAACDGLMDWIDEPRPAATLRRQVMTLLGRFATHRHRGADLVYEAYGVDLGGG